MTLDPPLSTINLMKYSIPDCENLKNSFILERKHESFAGGLLLKHFDDEMIVKAVLILCQAMGRPLLRTILLNINPPTPLQRS